MTETVPIYLDSSFWAVIVAVSALALSQLPPIHLWFRRARLDVEVYSRIAITHKVGNPNVTIHLILANVGGRVLRIKKLSLEFFRNGTNVFNLPVQNYFEKPDSKSAIIFTPFSLKPNEEWSHSSTFLNFFDRDDEKKYRILESTLRTDIQEKRAIAPADQLVEANPENVIPLLEFFESKFGWTAGEYEVIVNILADRVEQSKKFRFTIFESESEELRALSNEYKYGSGIYWDRTDIAQSLAIELHEADA